MATACSELDLTPTDAMEQELRDMLDTPAAGSLLGELATARQVYRELDFLLDLPSVRLRGQIDLIYQDGDGQWHIVDYKSDRVEGEQIDARARGYSSQVHLYAAAAMKHYDLAEVTGGLYFLRPGVLRDMEVTPESVQAACDTASDTARRLIAARRSNTFEHQPAGYCDYCPYRSLCPK